MTWQYLVANVILKEPFADEEGKAKAYKDLTEIIKRITPAFFHDSQFTVVPVDKLPSNNVCSNDRRECGCGE